MHLNKSLSFAAILGLWSQLAAAQLSAPPITSALPGVSRISIANAAGVLSYCEQKNLVSGASTDSILDSLATKPDTRSTDYLAGQTGQIHGDGGKTFVIAQVPGYLQSQACNIVLQQAKTFPRR